MTAITNDSFEEVKVERIFDYKQPDYHQVQDMENLNSALYALLEQLNFSVPNGRCKQLALTKLEECAMWAKRGIVNGS